MIEIGPKPVSPELQRVFDDMRKTFTVVNTNDIAATVHSCGCIGPQPGQTKCPCALRAEAEQGREMIRNGVVINGVLYKLVPAK